MICKIMTYCDPYRLNEAHYWPLIKEAPHLCVSQTMVNGLESLYLNKFGSVICTVEDVLTKLYSNWVNTETYIAQFVELSRLIEDRRGKISEELYSALQFSQKELLQSLRCLCELRLEPNEFNTCNITQEQSFLLDVFKEISAKGEDSTFYFAKESSISEIQQALIAIGHEKKKEISEKNDPEFRPRRLFWIEEVLGKLQKVPERIVIHGVHQFKPLILDFINTLNKSGVEVVLLINYQNEFPSIYGTWDNVYQFFDRAYEQDTNHPQYNIASLSQSNVLGSYIGNHGIEIPDGDYKNIKFIEFDNVTEFANYVSNVFENAKTMGKKDVLAGMKEHFYSASGKVNDILKTYHPDQFSDRHFLAYPIGQFFLGLYQLWDPSVKALKYDEKYIKECLNAGVFKEKNKGQLLSTFHRISIYFNDVRTLERFLERIRHLAKERQQVVEKDVDLKKIACYSEQVSNEDIEVLKQAIIELNELAILLFEEDDSGKFDFRTHFTKLLGFLEKHAAEEAIASEEKKLIHQLLERFGSIDEIELTGTLNDLRSGIFYFLKQVEESNSAKWIVRNFEQIDGDILRSHSQPGETIYHFACISDKDMLKTSSDLLPWPMTESFLLLADNLSARIYLASAREYCYFLRYSLFYGLYYNQRNVKLSYIKREDDEYVQPYFLLRMLGLEPQPNDNFSGGLDSVAAYRRQLQPNDRHIISIDNRMARSFKMCNHRFAIEHFLDTGGVYEDSWLIQWYLQVLLLESTWKEIEGFPGAVIRNEILNGKIDSIFNRTYRRALPFLRSAEYFDIRKRVKENLLRQCIENMRYKLVDGKYMQIKKDFINAKYTRDGLNIVSFFFRNSYSELEPKINEFINNNYTKDTCSDVWCSNCVEKDVCFEWVHEK